MASATAKKPCAKCQKGAGVTTCDGCHQSFCIKHIIEHRQELATQMEDIGQEHDSLRRDLIQEDLRHPLLLQIDEWEQTSITKIQVAAETARADLRQLLNQTKNDVKTSVDKIADELQTHRGLDDYTEADLTRWSAQLKEVRKLTEAPSTIEIVPDPDISMVIHPIKVHEQMQLLLPSNFTRVLDQSLLLSQKLLGSTKEKFCKVMDLISLSENDLVATYADEGYDGYRTVFGKNLYCAGVHNIHFRIEKKSNDNLFFGIVTSSQGMESRIFDKSTANGWWGFDFPVVNGEAQERCGEYILQTGDVVKLTLYCDNNRIRFESYRTKMIVHSLINIKKCPFPWKIAISLSRPNDLLRILC